MRADLFSSTLTTPETGAVLEHPNFGEWRRNMTRAKFLNLPRLTGPGRSGGEYLYAHVAEMALVLGVGSAFSREVGAAFAFAVMHSLKRRASNTQAMQEVWQQLDTLSKDYANIEEGRRDLVDMVVAPQVFFHESAISRDPDNRTWAVFIPSRIAHDSHSIRLVREGDAEKDCKSFDLRDLRKSAYDISTEGSSDDAGRDHFAQYAHAPGVVDLTGIFLRFEKILDFRLNARTFGRKI